MSCWECCSCLMCHRMYNTKQRIRKCHTCKALCIVHLCSCFHVSFERSWKIIKYHLDCLNCKRVCICTIQSRYISFNCMSQSIHTCIGNLMCRKCFYQLRVNNCNIWCNIKICQWIFDSFCIVCDHRECSNFCCCSWCRRNCRKLCFLTQFWEVKRNT